MWAQSTVERVYLVSYVEQNSMPTGYLFVHFRNNNNNNQLFGYDEIQKRIENNQHACVSNNSCDYNAKAITKSVRTHRSLWQSGIEFPLKPFMRIWLDYRFYWLKINLPSPRMDVQCVCLWIGQHKVMCVCVCALWVVLVTHNIASYSTGLWTSASPVGRWDIGWMSSRIRHLGWLVDFWMCKTQWK